jgi:hypothetical protein
MSRAINPAGENKKMSNKERLDQHDTQIAAIRKLIKDGMKLVVGTRQDIRFLAKDMIKLQAAQRKTDASLKAYLDSLKTGGNGHRKGKVDLQ